MNRLAIIVLNWNGSDDAIECVDSLIKQTLKPTIVIVDNGGGARSALVQTEIEPTVKGVVVVWEGGGDILVQTRVTEAITTVLNIPSNRVCVTKLS